MAWYQLDPLDNDLAFFFQNLITGIARQLPDFETEILNIVKRSPDLAKESRRIAAMMASTLSATIKDELVLIIDDYHTINEIAIHIFIENLLEYLPDKVHMVLASRTKPPFSLTRLKLSGLVKEISPEELRFTRDEIAVFLQIESSKPVFDQLVSLVDEKTTGWPAALRLASLSMESTSSLNLTDIYKKPLNNTELYRYLATEVMDSMTEEMSHFLCELSMFEFFTVKICDIFWEQGGFHSSFGYDRAHESLFYYSRGR